MTFDQLVLLAESDDNIEVEREYWDGAKTKLQYEEWFKDAQYHRLNGPAYQWWDKNGQKQYEAWLKDGEYHCLDGPAVQRWFANGQKEYEAWLKDDKCHRLDGPAVQKWDEDGNKIREEYFINGKELTPKEFKQLINQYDSDDLETFNDLTS